MDRQRFCTRICSDAFYAEERRKAVKAFRGSKTYPEYALADADAPKSPHDGSGEGVTFDGRQCR